jgi:choline kinase/phosphatidylglycerophosphate synthase
MIKQAVILAAGNGSRIKRFKDDVPKPLRKVCGLTLIKRAILNAKKAGITDFVIVVGHKGDQIISSLREDSSLGVNLQFVTNSDYHKSNGVSLLASRSRVHDNFLLMMADHIVDFKAIQKIVRAPFGKSEVLLGVDKKLEEIFDLDDVTKVKTSEDKIVDIGKQLTDYDAFDTGLFVCSSSLFEALEKIYCEKGDVSLSEGIRSLASQGCAGTCDLSGYFWQDVDTPESLKHAEKLLFQTLRKPTDGWIAQNINRRISLTISRLLIRTNLSANHVTGLVTLVGVFSGLFVSTGRYRDMVIGGILFNLASILDGCDGEISKLKLSSSKTGEWLDTISDNLTYLVFLVGVTIGTYRQGPLPYVIFESAIALSGVVLTLGLMFFYLIRYTNSGSLVTIQKDLNEEDAKSGSRGVSSWLGKIKFMMKRDFFALLFMILTLMNQPDWILHLCLIGANVTWMVVLAYKKEIFNPAKVMETQR